MMFAREKYSHVFKHWSLLAVTLSMAIILSMPTIARGDRCQVLFEEIPELRLGWGKTEFQQIKDLGDEIMAIFPPDKFYYVSAGQSMTAFIAYFRARYVDSAANLPLSSMRNKYAHEDQLHNGQLLPKLYEHFRRFLPTREVLGKRRILLMDYARSGNTMINARRYLSSFYGESPYQEDTVVFPLIITLRGAKLAADAKFPTLYAPEPLGRALDGQVYKYWSEYGFFRIDEHKSEDLVSKPRFQYLVEEIRKRLARSP